MWRSSKPLTALRASWPGNSSSKAKSRHFVHVKDGPYAAAYASVDRVRRQVYDFEKWCARHELDENHRTIRCVRGFFGAVRHHETALTGYSEDNVEAHDSLERASGNLVAAASTLYAIEPALFRAKMGVELLSAVRGLNSKEAFEQYLADLKTVADDRRERAAFFKQRREEGYVDVNGKKRSPAEITKKKERLDAWRADPIASRTSATGQGLQNEEANNASMRKMQDSRARDQRRLREKIDAAHKERNAPPPPPGAERCLGGYVARSYLVPRGEPNPPTWDDTEITRRVAEFRERRGVPELDPTVYGTYVKREGSGWSANPPHAVLRKLAVKERAVYNHATRACFFLEKPEAEVVIEKFLAPSTSDVERKAIMARPREAFICAHCGKGWLDRRQSTGTRLLSRQKHERLCPERSSSSSEEEESDEDEPEEEEPEEAVVAEARAVLRVLEPLGVLTGCWPAFNPSSNDAALCRHTGRRAYVY
mmetsp:Transcript_26285/g.68326  ORF Transcript_26285/g.68326 Transcript_26285/m.68326 type:complete len:481 (+) Transcript_26285:70-1512(+)